MADDEEQYEDEYTDGSYEDDENAGFEDDADGDFADDADGDFDDADFGDNDGFDDDGDGGGGDGWDDDDVDVTDHQYVIPIQDKLEEDSDEYVLDKDGKIISPKASGYAGMSRQKSIDIQCWTCSNCKATNKLSWTLTKFAMKCCMCKQDTYTPSVKIFDSNDWDEPSNDFWECRRCTLHNPIGTNECEACQQDNDEYIKQSDDETYGNNLFIKDEDSDDDMQQHHGMGMGMGAMPGMSGMGMQHHGHQGMGGMGRRGMMGGDMEQMLGGMFGMGGGMTGGMGMRGMRGNMGMHSHGHTHGFGGGDRIRRKRTHNTKPFDKSKEGNLRNLLIIGFIRKNSGRTNTLLPRKFFDYFNLYYLIFDRWDWGFFRGCWTSKKNDLITIKRGVKDASLWKNMYGLKHIDFDILRDKYPRKYEWRLRLLDRKQIELEHENINAQSPTQEHKEKEVDSELKIKKESFEIEYMDVIIGVVNVDKMPSNQVLNRAFNMYSCGYGLFAGNGKIYRGSDNDWVRVMKAVKHKDFVSVCIEWMERKKFRILYEVSEKGDKFKGNDDDIVVALTFYKNDEKSVGKGMALCLPSSVSYKLAVSCAKKRFEIEWISSGWVMENVDENDNRNDMDIDNNDDDDDVKHNV